MAREVRTRWLTAAQLRRELEIPEDLLESGFEYLVHQVMHLECRALPETGQILYKLEIEVEIQNVE